MTASDAVEFVNVNVGITITPDDAAVETGFVGDVIEPPSEMWFSDNISWFRIALDYEVEESAEATELAANRYTERLITERGLPAGGFQGQALVKKTGSDFEVEWVTLSGGGGIASLASLSDVTFTSAQTGHVVRFDGTEWVNGVLTKDDVGLSNVNNTSDLAKPISTATQNALNNKSDVGHTHALPSLSLNDLSDVDTATAPPTLGQALVWGGAQWEPGSVASGGDGGSGGGAVSLLKEIELTADASSIALSATDLAGDYDALMIDVVCRSTAAAAVAQLFTYLNGDTVATNYRRKHHYSSSTPATDNTVGDEASVGFFAAANQAAGVFSHFRLHIPNPKSTSSFKLIRSDWSLPTTVVSYSGDTSLLWENLAALTSLTLTPSTGNFLAGSTVRVYAIGASTSSGGGGGGVAVLEPADSAPPAGTAIGTVLFKKLDADYDALVASIGNVGIYHKMQETSGTSLADSSGNNRTATLVNGTGVNNTTDGAPPGLLGTAVRLDGSDDHILLNGTAWMTGLDTGGAGLTIHGWFLTRSWAGWSRYFDFYSSTNDANAIWIAPSNQNNIQVNITASSLNVPYWSLGVYHHIALVMPQGGGLTKLYVDGKLYGEKILTAGMNNKTTKTIGKSSYPDPYAPVSVTRFAVHNKMISADDALRLYSAGAGINSGKAIGWWDGTTIQPLA